MKLTLQVPNHLYFQVKHCAELQGSSVQALIVKTLARMVGDDRRTTSPTWLACFGRFANSKQETATIQANIDADLSRT